MFPSDFSFPFNSVKHTMNRPEWDAESVAELDHSVNTLLDDSISGAQSSIALDGSTAQSSIEGDATQTNGDENS